MITNLNWEGLIQELLEELFLGALAENHSLAIIIN
jgi:hypothetical protein